VRVQHVNHVESCVLCARVYWGTKGNKQCYDSNGVNSLALEAIEGLCRLLEPLLVIAHILEGRQEKDFCLAAIVNEDFGNVPSVDVDGEDHGVDMRERS
jgi:hypothetical protein